MEDAHNEDVVDSRQRRAGHKLHFGSSTGDVTRPYNI